MVPENFGALRVGNEERVWEEGTHKASIHQA